MEQRIVRYVGGPLDGAELDVTGWDEGAVRSGTYEVVDGWADRADYEPEPGGDRWCGCTAGPWPGSRTARPGDDRAGRTPADAGTSCPQGRNTDHPRRCGEQVARSNIQRFTPACAGTTPGFPGTP